MVLENLPCRNSTSLVRQPTIHVLITSSLHHTTWEGVNLQLLVDSQVFALALFGSGNFFVSDHLVGAEAIPDIDVGKKKFALNIMLPSSDETGEIRLVFDTVSPLT